MIICLRVAIFVISLIVAFLSYHFFNSIELPYVAPFVGFIVCVIFYFGFFIIYALACPHLPIILQKPLYYYWKNQLTKIKVSPLIDYPFQIWINFNLDSEFEKGGLFGAQKAVLEYTDFHF